MKKIIYLSTLLTITAVLVFVGCDKTSSEVGINVHFDFKDMPYSINSGGGVTLQDIPPEYDSIGMVFGEIFTAIAKSLIKEGVENPTMHDIRYEAKKYCEEHYTDLNPAMVDTLDIYAYSDDNSFLNLAQQKVLSKINDVASISNPSIFMQKIPTMVGFIHTLPIDEREPLFIYLASIKYGVISFEPENTLYISWKTVGSAACAIWGFVRFFSLFNPITASVGRVADGACVAVALVAAAEEIVD